MESVPWASRSGNTEDGLRPPRTALAMANRKLVIRNKGFSNIVSKLLKAQPAAPVVKTTTHKTNKHCWKVPSAAHYRFKGLDKEID